VYEQVAEVLESRGFASAETTLTTIREDASQARPAVLLIDTALYYFDPEAFHSIAEETGSKLALVHDPREAVTLLKRMLSGASASGLYGSTNNGPSAAMLEADTAKFSKEAVHKQLEIMRELGAADTLKLDRKTVRNQVDALHRQTLVETVAYDRKTLREQLDRLRKDEEAEATQRETAQNDPAAK
jgi:hypothetical protein